ncbi:hypothetical protein PRUPE_2G060500 [Prunus persica]|uniref:Reverse transcriptase domain-containing protein n=1 Tax=Prunus persica TaxID=3760 RepID=A0A251QC44_PRUPE|nr:hypothetical protein PRUPE_2G060500 [Prunus persica]
MVRTVDEEAPAPGGSSIIDGKAESYRPEETIAHPQRMELPRDDNELGGGHESTVDLDPLDEIVQNSINNLVTDFFSGNSRLELLNHTHIVLIPKIPKPTSVNHFRPISLCNNSYKILSKLLANRLKTLLPMLISQHQNAFIPGRQIQDNILLAHEAFHYLRLKSSKKSFELGLKLDMNKAYDRIEWDFLEATLCKFGFDNRWVELVMLCVKTITFSLVLNGSPGSPFSPSRGLRQGDPLSPYLFLLVSEVLSLNIINSTDTGMLRGIKLSRGGPELSHLFFADDSLFFLQATPPNCSALKSIIECYCSASGQEVEALTYVRDRINSKIAGWKLKLLSQAGREVLIKSVAAAIPAYPMSCFLLLATICNSINADLARFWWGHDGNQGKIHWHSWKKLCRPKAEGGMGFRDLQAFNWSLLAKQCWRILRNPTTLWARILKARYFPECSFLDAKKGGRASWAWSSLLVGRDIIEKGARWQIGNGHLVSVWKDRWLMGYGSEKISPLPSCNRFTPLLVADLIDVGNRSWNISHIEPFIHPSEAMLIRSTPIGSLATRDRLVWPAVKNGDYTVKSGYYHAINVSPPDPCDRASSSHAVNSDVWKVIWRAHITPKIRNFMWRALTNSIPTCANLFGRKLARSPTCRLCGLFPETVEHLLLLCSWTRAVWFGCPFGYTPDLASITTLDSWLSGFLRSSFADGDQRDWGISLFMFCSWEIWKARCKAIFNDIRPSPPLAKTGVGGIGAVIRDHNGSFIGAASQPCNCSSAAECEASAAIMGLSFASSFHVQNVVVETDCSELVSCVKKGSASGNWRFYPFLAEFRRWKRPSSNVTRIGFFVKLTELLMLPPS